MTQHTFGNSVAAKLLESDLRSYPDRKLLSRVSRIISIQLTHLRSINMIDLPISREYARHLWRRALPDVVGHNNWPENIRTLTLNVLVGHYRKSFELERENAKVCRGS